jgi:hypothetical protein
MKEIIVFLVLLVIFAVAGHYESKMCKAHPEECQGLTIHVILDKQ